MPGSSSGWPTGTAGWPRSRRSPGGWWTDRGRSKRWPPPCGRVSGPWSRGRRPVTDSPDRRPRDRGDDRGDLPSAVLFDEVVGPTGGGGPAAGGARRPVHAYLLHGPPGSGKRAAARALAAALLCPDGGCGRCNTCRRALAGTHPDLVVVERSGASLDVDEARSIVTRAQRRPLEASRQVLMVTDVHLATRSAPALLKTVEEPPPATVFVLLADDLPASLATIASRCVKVAFGPVAHQDVVDWLVARGVDPEHAESVARASGGTARPGPAAGRRPRLRRPPAAVAVGPVPAGRHRGGRRRGGVGAAGVGRRGAGPAAGAACPGDGGPGRSGRDVRGQGHHRPQAGRGRPQARGTAVAHRRPPIRAGHAGRAATATGWSPRPRPATGRTHRTAPPPRPDGRCTRWRRSGRRRWPWAGTPTRRC